VGGVEVRLFSTGFLQVFFVAINTIFLANQYYLGVVFASFAISLIWSFNVKKVAFGSMRDRLIYAIGAMTGSVAGLFVSQWFLQ
jgi:hypothetical protein